MVFAPASKTLAVTVSSSSAVALPVSSSRPEDAGPGVYFWDTETYQQRGVTPLRNEYVCGRAYSADGRLLACGGSQGSVQLCDTATGREELALAWGERAVRGVAFSPDGRLLALAGEDGTVRLVPWGTLLRR
jgi:WD40 repeat protein